MEQQITMAGGKLNRVLRAAKRIFRRATPIIGELSSSYCHRSNIAQHYKVPCLAQLSLGYTGRRQEGGRCRRKQNACGFLSSKKLLEWLEARENAGQTLQKPNAWLQMGSMGEISRAGEIAVNFRRVLNQTWTQPLAQRRGFQVTKCCM